MRMVAKSRLTEASAEAHLRRRSRSQMQPKHERNILVLHITRKYSSLAAAYFAAGCFLFSPMLLRKLTISEPDTIITLLCFAALVLWWRGAQGCVSYRRWFVCGMLLSIAAMAKGPQPF